MNILNRKIKLCTFIIISVIVAFVLNYKIETDINYHTGKDGAYFKRLESIVILSVLFFTIISRNRKIFYGLIGFIISIIVTLTGLFISNFLPKFLSRITLNHFLVFGISYAAFFGIEKLINHSFKHQI